jgi:hypothetical protein
MSFKFNTGAVAFTLDFVALNNGSCGIRSKSQTETDMDHRKFN